MTLSFILVANVFFLALIFRNAISSNPSIISWDDFISFLRVNIIHVSRLRDSTANFSFQSLGSWNVFIISFFAIPRFLAQFYGEWRIWRMPIMRSGVTSTTNFLPCTRNTVIPCHHRITDDQVPLFGFSQIIWVSPPRPLIMRSTGSKANLPRVSFILRSYPNMESRRLFLPCRIFP